MKYKNGIFIGKFYPLHLGHIDSINTLSQKCEQGYVLFYYNPEKEETMHKNNGYKYHIDQRIQDCQQILTQKNICVLKLKILDNKPFPQNKDIIFNEIKKNINKPIDVQIFGGDESHIYKPHIYAKEYIAAEPYMIADNKGKEVNLHSCLIREDYNYYRKYLPKLIQDRLDILVNKK